MSILLSLFSTAVQTWEQPLRLRYKAPYICPPENPLDGESHALGRHLSTAVITLKGALNFQTKKESLAVITMSGKLNGWLIRKGDRGIKS